MSTRRPGASTWENDKQQPVTQVAFGVLIAVLILFLWLHFILAQQTEIIGRQMTAANEELQRIERHNQELLQEITLAESQANMSQAARALGFEPQQPLYLAVNQPLAAGSGQSAAGKTLLFWMLSSVPLPVLEAQETDTEPTTQAAGSPSVADLP